MPCAVAGRARDRVLVFAGEALHDVDAAVPRPGDGRRAGRRLAGRRRPRRLGAVAARARDRHVGRRLRRPVCLPGSRLRSRARPAVDSGALRRAGVARDLARDARRRDRRASLALVVRRRRSARSIWPASPSSPRCSSTSSRSSAPTTCRRSSARSISNGYVGILYLLVLAAVAVCAAEPDAADRRSSAITGASGAIYATRTMAALLVARRARRAGRFRLRPPAAARRAGRRRRRSIRLHAVSGRQIRRRRRRGHARPSTATAISGATIASGSHGCGGMVIVPCSMKTLAGVAHGLSRNLVERAADVMLKERRRLVIVPRETPMSLPQLKNMVLCAEAGAMILPGHARVHQRAQDARRPRLTSSPVQRALGPRASSTTSIPPGPARREPPSLCFGRAPD